MIYDDKWIRDNKGQWLTTRFWITSQPAHLLVKVQRTFTLDLHHVANPAADLIFARCRTEFTCHTAELSHKFREFRASSIIEPFHTSRLREPIHTHLRGIMILSQIYDLNVFFTVIQASALSRLDTSVTVQNKPMLAFTTISVRQFETSSTGFEEMVLTSLWTGVHDGHKFLIFPAFHCWAEI